MTQRAPTSFLFPYTTLFRSVQAELAPLAFADSLVLVHALLPGSPAIDAASVSAPGAGADACEELDARSRSEEHTSELQSRLHLVCRLLLEKKNSSVITISLI